MKVRVQVPGVPNATAPATWPFPTAGLVSYDPVGGTAIFEVPDEDVPPQVATPGSGPRVVTPVGVVLTGLPPQAMAAWHAHLDRRYQEVSGRYRPQVG